MLTIMVTFVGPFWLQMPWCQLKEPDSTITWDVMTWKSFPHHWHSVRGIYWWLVDFLHKEASHAEPWCFLCRQPEQVAEQTVEMVAIWDAIRRMWRQCFRNNCCHVTLWILNTADILQPTLSNAVSCRKLLYIMINISQHIGLRWLFGNKAVLPERDNSLVTIRRHAIWLDNDQTSSTLQWRHNERDAVSNHQRLDGLLNPLFRRRSKKTSKFHVTGRVIGEFP